MKMIYSSPCTNAWQSQRLMAIGILPDTADVYKYSDGTYRMVSMTDFFDGVTESECADTNIQHRWSTNRLIKMVPEEIVSGTTYYNLNISSCDISYVSESGRVLVSVDSSNDMYDMLIKMLKWLIDNEHLDKSYYKNPYIRIEIRDNRGSVLHTYEKVNNTMRDTVIHAINSGVDLSTAVITGAEMDGCDLSKVKLTHTEFNKCNFDNCIFEGANIQFAQFNDCSLKNAQLSCVNATHTLFNTCNLIDANFSFAHINRCKFHWCNITDIVFYNTNIVGANFGMNTIDKTRTTIDSPIQIDYTTQSNIKTMQVMDLVTVVRTDEGLYASYGCSLMPIDKFVQNVESEYSKLDADNIKKILKSITYIYEDVYASGKD